MCIRDRANAGTFSVSGQNLEFIDTNLLSLDTGTFTLTGENVTLIPNLTLPMATGVFTLSGQTLGVAQEFPITGLGSFGLAGQDLDIVVVRTRRFEKIDNTTSVEVIGIGANNVELSTQINEAA